MNTRSKCSKFYKAVVLFAAFIGLTSVSSCCSGIETPDSTKYIKEFHELNFEESDSVLPEGQLCLFVDFSTCNMLGQSSSFFQELTPSFTKLTKHFFSIKGSSITEENLDEHDVYWRLHNISEVNYADLKNAANLIASSSKESVLLTDGEYFIQDSSVKDSDKDPWLTDALTNWILQGYDVHIFSEPYVETYHGIQFNKKRFYIIFTDDRMPNNIYDRIIKTVDLTKYPDIDEFHISASHPQLRNV